MHLRSRRSQCTVSVICSEVKRIYGRLPSQTGTRRRPRMHTSTRHARRAGTHARTHAARTHTHARTHAHTHKHTHTHTHTHTKTAIFNRDGAILVQQYDEPAVETGNREVFIRELCLRNWSMMTMINNQKYRCLDDSLQAHYPYPAVRR